jgi:hypothetical protein
MRTTILMGSVAAMALATPAFALPDRYEQGYSCTGRGAICTQERLQLEDGNRFDEKARDGGLVDGSSSDQSQAAARSTDNDTFGDEAGDEIENTADEAGDEISEAADEAGDEVENTADEAGDEVSEAADEAGDAIDDAFD